MPILTVVIVLIIVGVLLYLVNRYIPMDSTVKTILNIVVILVLIVWLLKAFNIWGGLNNVTL